MNNDHVYTLTGSIDNSITLSQSELMASLPGLEKTLSKSQIAYLEEHLKLIHHAERILDDFQNALQLYDLLSERLAMIGVTLATLKVELDHASELLSQN